MMSSCIGTDIWFGGELDSTGRDEVLVACPGSKEAWLNTLGLTLLANHNLAMAA